MPALGWAAPALGWASLALAKAIATGTRSIEPHRPRFFGAEHGFDAMPGRV